MNGVATTVTTCRRTRWCSGPTAPWPAGSSPSPGRTRCRPTPPDPDGTPYSDDELAESEQALAELTHAVLAVTLPPDVDLGTLTVDGTGLEAWVRRRTRRDALAGSSDPDCDWRVRDKDGERQSLLGYSLPDRHRP